MDFAFSQYAVGWARGLGGGSNSVRLVDVAGKAEGSSAALLPAVGAWRGSSSSSSRVHRINPMLGPCQAIGSPAEHAGRGQQAPSVCLDCGRQ